MVEHTSVVRADIEATRARMASAITQLEKKADVAQHVRDNPWPALAIAFGVGLALSASGTDVRAAAVSTEAAKKTGNSLGGALDGILATALAGVAASFQGHLEGALGDVMAAVKGATHPQASNGMHAGGRAD